MHTYAACAVFIAVTLALAPRASAGEVYRGRVVAVIDGHTMIALINQRRMEVRIAGIAAPVEAQRYAIASRQSLIAICGGEPVLIEADRKAAGGALVGRVVCNRTDAGAEQVRRGMATLLEGPGGPDDELARLHAEAQASKRGLWSDPRAVPAGR